MNKTQKNKKIKIAGGIVVGLALAGIVGYAISKNSKKKAKKNAQTIKKPRK